MKKFWVKKGLMFVTFFIAAALVFGAIVMALWNAILPAVTGVNQISYVQALGILLLSKILFGGFGRRGGWQSGRRQHWKHNLEDRWAGMTPEEKEKFKTEFRSRCGSRWNRDRKNSNSEMAE